MEYERWSIDDTGCVIDGHWGQYGIARLVGIAECYGYDDEVIIGIANRKMEECERPGVDNNITIDEEEWLSDAADDLDAIMNKNAAPEGYSFGWHDCEYYLFSNEDWELCE